MVDAVLHETENRLLASGLSERQPGRPVDFQQTIPRYLVHRAAVSEVFVTDLHMLGRDRFEVGAQWPRRHGFYGPPTQDSHDPMLYAETFRQALLLVAHRAYRIPLEHAFISDHKTCAVEAAGLTTAGRPVDVVMRISAHEVEYRGKNIRGMRSDVDCYRDGALIGAATERWRCISPAVYRRLRGDRFAAMPFQARILPTVQPALVGRERPEDVLVAETSVPGRLSLQFDPDHAVLFDHPVDHVPGMVLAEGARQAALLTVGAPRALPVRMDFEFHTFVEFDAECLLTTEELASAADGARVVRVLLEQRGRTVASVTLHLRLP